MNFLNLHTKNDRIDLSIQLNTTRREYEGYYTRIFQGF